MFKSAALFCAALLPGALAAPADLSARQSNVPYGPVIWSCTKPGVVALTFDDGPSTYTNELLDTLAGSGHRATFFVNGQNWGSIWDNVGTVQRMVNEGHQIGSHTMNHADLGALDDGGVRAEMTQLESALLDILGYFPQYMRPPYFSYHEGTLQTLGSMGYHVIQCDIDSQDWQHQTPDTIGASFAEYEAGLNSGGSLSLMHDVHQTTVQYLVPQVLNLLSERGLRSVPVGECLGDDPSNWYRAGR